MTSRVFRRGAEANVTRDPEALTGKLPDIVARMSRARSRPLAKKLAAGDVIITGSITPPLMIEADETELTHLLEPIGQVSVRFQPQLAPHLGYSQNRHGRLIYLG
mgnify:CR=1 FL=1